MTVSNHDSGTISKETMRHFSEVGLNGRRCGTPSLEP